MNVLRPEVVPVSLSALCAGVGQSLTCSDVVVHGAAVDSRSVQPGDLWCALPGQHRHGIAFALDAIARGASAILTDSEGARALAAQAVTQMPPVAVVSDVRHVAARVISAVFGHPSRAMTVVGVTGTNGKTSVTHHLRDAWAQRGLDCAALGTLGIRASEHAGLEGSMGFTTPEADVLQNRLALLSQAGVSRVAMEVSSHALSLNRVDGTQFSVVSFTNMTHDHLDFHGTMREYFEAKARLFTPEFSSRAAVCIDDEYGQEIAQRASGAGLEVLTFGLSGGDWRVTVAPDRVVNIDSAAGTIVGQAPSLGEFAAVNVAAAAAVLFLCQHSIAEVSEQLRSLTGVPGRMEAIHTEASSQPQVIVDYAHSPDSVFRVVQAVRAHARNLIVVMGAGGQRDAAKRAPMGSAASLADVVIVTDDNPRFEDAASIRAEVLRGVSGPHTLNVADRATAIRSAIAQAAVDDVVLILGKGAEQGQETSGVVAPFDDRVHARQALQEWTPA